MSGQPGGVSAAPIVIAAETRARLRDLRLSVRRAPAGAGVGQHHSRARGAGLEFSQYRAYEPGDEPRQIDWKLYGRSDRFFVREAERDSPLSLWLLIDSSASMNQADRAAPAHSKLDRARLLAACLAEIAVRQGDRFAAAAIGSGGLSRLPSGAGPRHRDRLMVLLSGLTASGTGPSAHSLVPLWEAIGPESLVVVISDGFEAALVSAAEQLALARREVLWIRLLCADERDFPFTGGTTFIDPETGARLTLDADRAREAFLERFRQAGEALGRRLEQSAIRHVTHVLDEPPDRPLGALFGAGVGR